MLQSFPEQLLNSVRPCWDYKSQELGYVLR